MSIPTLTSEEPHTEEPKSRRRAAVAAQRPSAAAAPRVPVVDAEHRRYDIHTERTPDLQALPSRFLVEVKRLRLARLLLSELWRYFGQWRTILNRPCIYGVFSGPVGGFKPRPRLCVGCLRCTIQHPDIVTIRHNPALQEWGDEYVSAGQVATIDYEAERGAVPVRGQGYRGRFGGTGWDAMWTDMSEIVRPTRDGIHGREYISTLVDLGDKTSVLELDAAGRPVGPTGRTLSIPLPMLLDVPPDSLLRRDVMEVLVRAAEDLGTLAVVPLQQALDMELSSAALVPLVTADELPALERLGAAPRMVELDGWDAAAYHYLRGGDDGPVVAVRLHLEEGWMETFSAALAAGARAFHLVADYHGRCEADRFVLELIQQAHRHLVEVSLREEATLLGSGGIVAAEHVPKAIIAGLDAVALDLPLAVALQCKPDGKLRHRGGSRFVVPRDFAVDWGVQRIKNLCAAWRDQLLEILGAMGIREVRRLRGEMGRAMFQRDLEADAFGDIEGYSSEVER